MVIFIVKRLVKTVCIYINLSIVKLIYDLSEWGGGGKWVSIIVIWFVHCISESMYFSVCQGGGKTGIGVGGVGQLR